MKVTIVLSVAFCLLTLVLFGQTKYFQIEGGSIIDSLTNAERKAKLVQSMKSSFPQKEAIITLSDKNFH